MSEDENRKIPRELEVAFGDAVGVFDADQTGKSDPPVGKYGSITEVCGLVGDFDDGLLAEIYDKLRSLMDATMMADRAELDRDPSYKVGARCLRKLVERRAKSRSR